MAATVPLIFSSRLVSSVHVAGWITVHKNITAACVVNLHLSKLTLKLTLPRPPHFSVISVLSELEVGKIRFKFDLKIGIAT